MLAPYNKRNKSQAPSRRTENNQLEMFHDPFKFQMDIFKEFDDFSSKIFGKMDNHFGFDLGFGKMFDKFNRMADFDAMDGFSNCKNF
jgi:hypothetical protein